MLTRAALVVLSLLAVHIAISAAYARYGWDCHYLDITVQPDLEKLRAEIVAANPGFGDAEIQNEMDARLANTDGQIMETLRKRIRGAGVKKWDVLFRKAGDGFNVKIRNYSSPPPMPGAAEVRPKKSGSVFVRSVIEGDAPGMLPYPVPLKVVSEGLAGRRVTLGAYPFFYMVRQIFFPELFINSATGFRPERASRFSVGRSPTNRPTIIFSPERAARIMRTPLQGLRLAHTNAGLRPTLMRSALSGLLFETQGTFTP